MKTAVVILNYNGKQHLELFLPSVELYTPTLDTEIIVADNASTDDSLDFLKENFPAIRVIRLDKNNGFAGGYNKALKEIEAEYFVLLNSDVELSENWLTPLVEYMDTHPNCAVCQPKLLSYTNKSKFEYAGAAGGFIDKNGFPFCRGRIFSTLEEDFGQYDEITEVFWASGACFFIRRDDFYLANGFDENFFAHMEEIDLCWRLKKMDKRIACIPQSKVYHLGGGTLSVESPRKTYLNFRNNLLMLYKNTSKQEAFLLFFSRFFLDYIAAIQMLFTGKAANAYSVIKARCDFKKMKRKYKPAATEGLKVFKEVYKKNVVLDYYIFKLKKYNKLDI